jgi:hypothetical protein
LPESAGGVIDSSTTALGDWYVNRLVVDRQPLLLLVSSTSRLAVVTTARDMKSLSKRLPSIVGARLSRLGVNRSAMAREIEASSVVVVARTADRSVLGQMVDFAKMIPFHLPDSGWSEGDLKAVEDRLAETPCRAGGRFEDVIFPRETTIRLLEDRWCAGTGPLGARVTDVALRSGICRS